MTIFSTNWPQRWVCSTSKYDLSSKTKFDQNHISDNYGFLHLKVELSVSFCSTSPQKLLQMLDECESDRVTYFLAQCRSK
jgi:hypothetical protein